MHTVLRRFTALAILGLGSACGGGTEPVVDNTIASVLISSSATTIAPGATVQLTAVPKNAAGTTVPGGTPTWSSSTQSVATVSSSGLVTAVANGTSTITATIDGKSGTRVITVATITPVGAATVDAGSANAFNPAQVDITAGGTVTWNFSGPSDHNVSFATTVSGTPANIGNTSNASVARTFTTAGSFPYQCTLHAGMNGTVIVH
jgi:trimeric autotransporter adhesin